MTFQHLIEYRGAYSCNHGYAGETGPHPTREQARQAAEWHCRRPGDHAYVTTRFTGSPGTVLMALEPLTYRGRFALSPETTIDAETTFRADSLSPEGDDGWQRLVAGWLIDGKAVIAE